MSEKCTALICLTYAIEVFTSLATSMSHALRDGSDASFNGAARHLVGEKGVLTIFYEIQWSWLSLHCASLLLGILFSVLTLVRNRSAPAWKPSSLAVMTRGQVQDVVHGAEYVKQMEGRAYSACCYIDVGITLRTCLYPPSLESQLVSFRRIGL